MVNHSEEERVSDRFLEGRLGGDRTREDGDPLQERRTV